jgi:hypothetical protein
MEYVMYFEYGTSFTPEPVLSILKFPNSQVSSFSTPESDELQINLSPENHKDKSLQFKLILLAKKQITV